MMSKRDRTIVLGVDPGLTFGWILGEGLERIDGGKEPAEAFLEKIYPIINSGVIGRVASERFDPRRWDNDSKLTVEFIGALKFICRHAGVPLGEVNAADKNKIFASKRAPTEADIPNKHTRDAEAVRLWDLRYGKWS